MPAKKKSTSRPTPKVKDLKARKSPKGGVNTNDLRGKIIRISPTNP